jgi:hypothetical protein
MISEISRLIGLCSLWNALVLLRNKKRSKMFKKNLPSSLNSIFPKLIFAILISLNSVNALKIANRLIIDKNNFIDRNKLVSDLNSIIPKLNRPPIISKPIGNSIKTANPNSQRIFSKSTRHLSNDLDPLWYLNKFGYLDGKKLSSSKKSGSLMMIPSFLGSILPSTMSPSIPLKNNEVIEEAIKKFQKFANLPITGKLDNETINMMKLPRCGHPDIVDPDYKDDENFNSLSKLPTTSSEFSSDDKTLTNSGYKREKNDINDKNKRRKRRYALQGSKWSKSKLKFRVAKYPTYSTMSRDLIDQELTRALELWSEVSDVSFEQVKDTSKSNLVDSIFYGVPASTKSAQKADIDVRFETGYHGDSEPFDGSGLILGNRKKLNVLYIYTIIFNEINLILLLNIKFLYYF